MVLDKRPFTKNKKKTDPSSFFFIRDAECGGRILP
jgi:hypothetical protein